MTHRRTAWTGLALLGALAFTSPAFGDKDARDKLRDDKKELKEDRDKIREARRAGDGGALAEAKREWRRDRKQFTEDQLKRRKERLAELRQKWGPQLKNPAFREEMRLHEHRMAKLRQIERTAKAEKKDALVKRVDALKAKENTRHQKALEGFKTDGGAK